MRTQKGFTLVELSIALVIIGIFVAGVLKGQEMIRSAQIARTISQMKEFHAAYNGFYNKYQAYPGDMLNATDRIPGCNATNNCTNGNGDLRVGQFANFSHWHTEQTGSAMPAAETTQFWKHLALSDFIGGVQGSANPAVPEWGNTHPATRMGGGYTALYLPESGLAPAPNVNVRLSGNMIRQQGFLSGAGSSIVMTGEEPYTVHDVFEIDTKMDDGQSQTGLLQAEDACDVSYDMTRRDEKCVMFYLIGR